VKVVEGSEVYNFPIHHLVHFYSNFWSFERSNRTAVTRNKVDRRRATTSHAVRATRPCRACLTIRFTRRPRHRAFPRNVRAVAASKSSPSRRAPGCAPRRTGRTGAPMDRRTDRDPFPVERACQGRRRTGKLRWPCSLRREGRELAGYKVRLLPVRRPTSRPPSMPAASSCRPALPPPTKRITAPHSPLQPPRAACVCRHHPLSPKSKLQRTPPPGSAARLPPTCPTDETGANRSIGEPQGLPTLSPLTPAASSPESGKGRRRLAPGTQLRVP
jgi:hypothetical protein